MKLIVTGGLGHIGSALIRRTDLIPAGSEIVIVDDLSTQRFPSLFDLPDSLKYTLREGDVADALVPSDLHRADAVIHLAAKTDPTESVRNPESFFANNLRLTKHVASLCTQHGVPLVFASSTSVYTPTDGRITESTPTENPHSPYAQCKVAEEEVLASAFREGLVGTSFRLGTIYGPSPGMRFHTAVNFTCLDNGAGSEASVLVSSRRHGGID
jgi:UDP-glucose 4-epimerase